MQLAEGEIAVGGAEIGGGFENTQKLRVMNYNEAMATKDKDQWLKAVDEEHQRMI